MLAVAKYIRCKHLVWGPEKDDSGKRDVVCGDHPMPNVNTINAAKRFVRTLPGWDKNGTVRVVKKGAK